jgi:hypothetical protein
MKLIGNKKSFAFEIADHSVGDMRVVDIWINDISICCDDNTVYLPQFIADIEYFLSKELDLKKYERYFVGLSPEQIHEFIGSTNDEDSPNFDLVDDYLCAHHEFLDLGPTTDNVSSYVLKVMEKRLLHFHF